MALFGSRDVTNAADRQRTGLSHQRVLSPAPGTGSATVGGTAPKPPDTSLARSTATLAALAAAKRQRRTAMKPGQGLTPSGRPLGIGSTATTFTPRTLIGL